MSWGQDRQLVTDVARGAVRRAAPDELAQFDVTAEAFFAAPARARSAARRDEPLGLGLDSVSVLVTTAALTVTVEVLKHLAEHYSDRILTRVGRRLRALFTRRRGRPTRATLPALSQEQLAALHALAVRKAAALEVPAERAALIADGIVAELVVPDPPGPVDGA